MCLKKDALGVRSLEQLKNKTTIKHSGGEKVKWLNNKYIYIIYVTYYYFIPSSTLLLI